MGQHRATTIEIEILVEKVGWYTTHEHKTVVLPLYAKADFFHKERHRLLLGGGRTHWREIYSSLTGSASPAAASSAAFFPLGTLFALALGSWPRLGFSGASRHCAAIWQIVKINKRVHIAIEGGHPPRTRPRLLALLDVGRVELMVECGQVG